MADGDEYAETASEYDALVEQFQSHADAAVFGMMYDHIRAGERILDIGIGTGLASERLARYGLEVYGVDSSQAMLEQCAQKGIAKGLTLADVNAETVPFDDAFFDHVLTCGVLHFFEDLAQVFGEVVRVLKEGGTFTFTIMADADGGPDGGTVQRRHTKWGRDVFLQGSAYVKELCDRKGLMILSRLLVLGDVDPEDSGKNYYWVYVARKNVTKD